MQVIDDIPMYLQPALVGRCNRVRRRAILATARSLQVLPVDTALEMVRRVYVAGTTLPERREASAVGWLLLYPEVLTALEMSDDYTQS